MATGLIELMFCLDTTGSMYPCLTQLRRNCEELVRRIFSRHANVRMGCIANGDYIDATIPGSYVTRMLDLTTDRRAIINFIRNVGPTNGGDLPECYELVLHKARTEVGWTAGATKVLVIVGDNVPHSPNYPLNTLRIDWRNELRLLLEADIHVYGVHALGHHHTRSFYQEIASETKGYCLELDQLHRIYDLVLAVCYKQVGDELLQQFEQEVTDAGRMDRGLDQIFAILLSRRPRAELVAPDLDEVPPGRFQVLSVDREQSIRDFVQENGLTFKKGRGFYEFTKPELVQETKEVVLLHNASGAMYTGEKARDMIGLPYGQRGKVKPSAIEGFTVFIQSTSVNRNLKPGTRFLYEVEDWGREE